MDAGATGEGCEELRGAAGDPGQQVSLGTASEKTELASKQENKLNWPLPALLFVLLFICFCLMPDFSHNLQFAALSVKMILIFTPCLCNPPHP